MESESIGVKLTSEADYMETLPSRASLISAIRPLGLGPLAAFVWILFVVSNVEGAIYICITPRSLIYAVLQTESGDCVSPYFMLQSDSCTLLHHP
jgi:hypothetical protein